MTSNRPYLLRALYDWIVDNGFTPYILIDADFPGTDVPAEFIQDGKLVLNISPAAVNKLNIGDSILTCEARFGGKALNVQCPIQAITAIYARENGHGMLFPDEEYIDDQPDEKPEDRKPGQKPDLKIVK